MQKLEKLVAVNLPRMTKPGMHSDGGGLYLQITKPGAKTWIFRYAADGRTRDMGLGAFHAVSLSDARTKAAECRNLRSKGIDPIDRRDAEKQAAVIEAAKAVTFSECATQYIADHSGAWRNAKHKAQWENTIATYAESAIGKLSVGAIDTSLVLKVLQPIWATKNETASRVRGRLESILDWAKVRGYRSGENPARWRGHLDHLLARPSKVQTVRHHPALPTDGVGRFVADLRTRAGVSPRALEFLILTAARTGEVVGALWPEIDTVKKIWTVPASRMKAGREHKVPLSDRALEILKEMRPLGLKDGPIFPGGSKGKGLSAMALEMLVRRMNGKSKPPTWCDENGAAIVPHGFRSTFRDWASEFTGYSREAIEMSLAHAIADKTEAAYRRGELLEKRRRLLNEWEKFCDTPITEADRDNVVSINRAS
jgi:integrase